jgi:hypothetical protein
MRLTAATLLVAVLGFGFWSAITSAPGTVQGSSGGEIGAAAEAVRAWGVFVSTGDIDRLSEWFAIDGPQYLQLQSEVAHIVPGSVRYFELSQAELLNPGLVRGSVTVSGGGGDQQVYRWDLELIQRDGHWMVWTVRTSPPTEPRT